MAEWKVDFTGDKEEDLDRIDPLPGWYRATVAAIEDDDKSGAQVVHYKITGPAFAGAVIYEKVWNPENAETEEKAAKTMARAKKVMSRLGLVGKDDLGREKVIKWDACIGREMVLQVIDDSYEGKDGKKVAKVSCGYLGMFPTDHASIPPAVRVQLGLPLLAGQTVEEAKKTAAGKRTASGPTMPANGTTPAAAPINAAEFANL